MYGVCVYIYTYGPIWYVYIYPKRPNTAKM